MRHLHSARFSNGRESGICQVKIPWRDATSSVFLSTNCTNSFLRPDEQKTAFPSVQILSYEKEIVSPQFHCGMLFRFAQCRTEFSSVHSSARSESLQKFPARFPGANKLCLSLHSLNPFA